MQGFVDTKLEEPSSVGPPGAPTPGERTPGPETIVQLQLTGFDGTVLKALVALVSTKSPLPPEKVTAPLPPSAGAKSVVNGASFTMNWVCAVSVCPPPLTCNCTTYSPTFCTVIVGVTVFGFVITALPPAGSAAIDQAYVNATPLGPMLLFPSMGMLGEVNGPPKLPLKAKTPGLTPPLTLGLAATPPAGMPARIQL